MCYVCVSVCVYVCSCVYKHPVTLLAPSPQVCVLSELSPFTWVVVWTVAGCDTAAH